MLVLCKGVSSITVLYGCKWTSLSLERPWFSWFGQWKNSLEGLGSCWAVTDRPLEKCCLCRTCWELLYAYDVEIICLYISPYLLPVLWVVWKSIQLLWGIKNAPVDELLKFLLALFYESLPCAETNLTDFSKSPYCVCAGQGETLGKGPHTRQNRKSSH